MRGLVFAGRRIRRRGRGGRRDSGRGGRSGRAGRETFGPRRGVGPLRSRQGAVPSGPSVWASARAHPGGRLVPSRRRRPPHPFLATCADLDALRLTAAPRLRPRAGGRARRTGRSFEVAVAARRHSPERAISRPAPRRRMQRLRDGPSADRAVGAFRPRARSGTAGGVRRSPPVIDPPRPAGSVRRKRRNGLFLVAKRRRRLQPSLSEGRIGIRAPVSCPWRQAPARPAAAFR